MNWLTRIFGRDRATDRIASAEAQRDDAHQQLAESRELAASTRRRVRENHITEGFAAAFERQERHA